MIVVRKESCIGMEAFSEWKLFLNGNRYGMQVVAERKVLRIASCFGMKVSSERKLFRKESVTQRKLFQKESATEGKLYWRENCFEQELLRTKLFCRDCGFGKICIEALQLENNARKAEKPGSFTLGVAQVPPYLQLSLGSQLGGSFRPKSPEFSWGLATARAAGGSARQQPPPFPKQLRSSSLMFSGISR